MTIAIQQQLLPYAERLDCRLADEVTLVVIHCTELPDLALARVWGEWEVHPASHTGNSGHFYIDRDGSVEQWAPLNRVAHHVKGHNPLSIGIELVNTGRYPNWYHSDHQQMTEPYPAAQIAALITLLNHLKTLLPGLDLIAGHEDLDAGLQPADDAEDIMVRRKLDPGPCFPWQELLAKITLRRLRVEDP